MSGKKMGGAGLRGQSAGETSICTVGVTGSGLTYRGYDVVDLAENTTFEEVAYLLLHEKLPSSQELKDYINNTWRNLVLICLKLNLVQKELWILLRMGIL